MKIMYVDVETTGVKRDKHSIWQIAGIIADGTVEEPFEIKMAPYTDEPISQTALDICGITEEELYSFQSVEDAYEQFTTLIKKYINPYDSTDKFYFCGYNAEFDSEFIRNFLLHNGDRYFGSYFWYPVLDVMQLANWYFVGKRVEFNNFKLATVYEKVLGKPLENSHNAVYDIDATRELLNFLVRNFDLFKRGK